MRIYRSTILVYLDKKQQTAMNNQPQASATRYQCEECGETFNKLSQLIQHRRTKNHWKKYSCPLCKKVFTRRQNLDRHMKKHNDEKSHHCAECMKAFTREDAWKQHMQQNHGQTGGANKRQHDGIEQSTAKKQKLMKTDNTEQYVNIEKVSERKVEKFNTTASYFKISVRDLEVHGISDILKTLQAIFNSIISRIAMDIPTTDLVRISMDNPELDFPIVLPFMARSALTVERVLTEIERVLQSYEQFVLDETFGIEFVHVHAPVGSGMKRKPYVDISKLLNDKKSIIQIRNQDNLCCARALVTAIAKIENHPQWDSIRRGYGIQKQLAIELHQKANVDLEECGLDKIKSFQTVLPEYQIHVLSKEHFNAIVYQGPEGGVPIYLYYHDEHFDVITKITGFLNRSYFCLQCKKGYNTKEKHACNNACHFCRHIHNEQEEENWLHCPKCNCKFINQMCFDLHTKLTDTGNSTCLTYYKCLICAQIINRNKHKSKEHVCGENYCKTCKGYFEEGHLCYMQTVENEDTNESQGKKDKTDNLKYIFFDFESRQDEQTQCDKGYVRNKHNKCKNCSKSSCGAFKHIPNLCVAQKTCLSCIKKEINTSSVCQSCGKNERIFHGPSTTEDFCRWLFSEENVGATVICHNFKGYDSYPILQYLHENAILPEVITTGSKYMSVKVPICKIRFIDSLNFITMPLADMPEAFGENELVKGFFPHLFNIRANQTAVLPHLPDVSYYNADGMKPESRKKFLEWYKEHSHDPFDFQAELLRYCRSDVDILRKCSLKFRSLFLDLTKTEAHTGVDPFERCITIASACNLVFRKNFLENESIGIIPTHGYRPSEKQSVMAYQWLSYLAHEKQIGIQHGRNTGEKQIGQFKVDGFYQEEDEKFVFEFHGCFWHGCPKCYSKETINPISDKTMGQLYADTMEKKEYLESEGCIYTCLWECDFVREIKENEAMKQYIQSLEIVSPLEPRDAFYGGRTEAFKLYESSGPEKHIKYYDVTSLYPYVNKTGKIPLGHPEIYVDNFKSIELYEGLIKCKILPPKGLHIPVLPAKCGGKLMFSLCRTCTETYEQSRCHHGDEERAFTGTWVTDEVKMALSHGYQILKTYEVWHFSDISQYDPDMKTGGVFTEYVNTFLKVKQQASGWPDWCVDEDSKQNYIQLYLDKEGILLEKDKIEKNPGLRSIAKLMLNSFWGKFGQRSNLSQTTYVDDPEQFMDMMTSDRQVVKNIQFVSDQAVQLDWVHKDDFVEAASRTNVVIAAYTTAQARLKLYSYLQPLGKRVLYCDTDSVVFTTSPGQWEPPLGDYLGDLTDEAPKNEILAFVTGGPKNYAYNLAKANKKGQTSICKVRGITLNYKNLLDINFDTVSKMVKGETQMKNVTVVDDNKICRSNGMIITKTERKDYKIVFDKRVIRNTVFTDPYGM